MTDIHMVALDFFKAHQKELVEKYEGKELLLHGDELVGAYDSVGEAYSEGVGRFGEGNFSLQTCIPGMDAYTMTVSTLGVIG
jgi:hypothetical protein